MGNWIVFTFAIFSKFTYTQHNFSARSNNYFFCKIRNNKVHLPVIITKILFSVVKPDLKLRFNTVGYENTYPNIFNKDSIYVTVLTNLLVFVKNCFESCLNII